jgi:sporulation protein YunB
VFLVILALAFCLLAVERSIIPTLVAISESQVTRVANQAMVDAINHNITGLLQGKEILDLEINSQGELLYVSINAAELNKIQAEALTILQTAVSGLEGFTVRVPLGQVLGSRIFAPIGPSLRVRMIPYGAVTVQVMDSVEVSGINQMKYKIFLRVTCMVRVVIPLISTNKEVVTDIPLTTFIVPGKVPNTYLSIPPSQ